MLFAPIVEFFKHKIVGSVIVLACWPKTDQVQLLLGLAEHGLRTTVTCDPRILYRTSHEQLQGILYFGHEKDVLLEKVDPEHFSLWYKWLVIANHIPPAIHKARYDSDITLLKQPKTTKNTTEITKNNTEITKNKDVELPLATYSFEDVYVHPSVTASLYPWAEWKEKDGFQLKYERERILRRMDLKKYPLRISTPMSRYVEGKYNGSFYEYVVDNRKHTLDSILGCGFAGARLLVQALNATEVLVPALLWTAKEDNRSMVYMMMNGLAEISGGGLRPLHERISRLDFLFHLCSLRLGFTYLAERDSNGNMFVTPFDGMVWWCCLGTGLSLAFLQRLTAKTPMEKDGAINAVLATILQQDASAVPEGASGRCTFMVLSLWAMMLYAYYSSSIVSALMSTGQKGPQDLRALADSRYAIASEDYDYIRDLMFDRKTNRPELEYLKKKKKTKNFYQSIERGVELVRSGGAAYHAEFNNFYPHLKTLTDNEVCKLSYVDTIPEALTWTVSTKRSPYAEILRSASCKLHERGLAKQVISHWRMQPAPCRAALLAERVKFSDVAPLIGVTLLGLLTSLAMMALERFYNKRMGEEWEDVERGSDEVAKFEIGEFSP